MTKLSVLLAMAVLAVLGPTAAIAKAGARDRDHDRLPDRWEKAHGLSTKRNDARQDPDKDGLSNLREYEAGTDPKAADSDSDGLSDGAEERLGTDPTAPGQPGADDSGDDGVIAATTPPPATSRRGAGPRSSPGGGHRAIATCEDRRPPSAGGRPPA